GGAAGDGGASGAPAALLAGSGVTVLSAADNTNMWEAQDFKVSLGGDAPGAGGLLFGGAGAASSADGGGGSGGGGGKKQPAVLPWFKKTADGKARSGPTGREEIGADRAGAAADSGKQQQQAEYFRDFMKYMSQLQQEKRTAPTPTPGAATAATAAAAAQTSPLQPTPARLPAVAIKPEPGVSAPPGPLAAVVKTEPGLYSTATAATATAAAAAGGDVEWEDVGGLPPVSQQPKLEEAIKTEPGLGGGGGGSAAMDADEEVEWEDV
ncbi:hypothetical protein Vretimale_6394, partial [Volvox reticuliferus]